MRSRRALQLARAVIVLLMMAAWFVAFDHCALVSVLKSPVVAEPDQQSCPGHSQPEKKQSQGKLPCCKSLVASTAPLKISASYDSTLHVSQPYLPAAFDLILDRFTAPILELDTGPPEIRTFAETVLQRSILAHAPPLRA